MDREKLEDIMNTIVKELNDSCTSCGITNDIIDKQSFICCPKYVIYCARLKGTSETDSSSLISLIEEWVNRGANISVTGSLLTVDADGPVAISSLNEKVCSLSTPDANTTTNSTDCTTIDIPAIVGGVVSGVVVIIIIIIIAFIVMFKFKSRIRKAIGNLKCKFLYTDHSYITAYLGIGIGIVIICNFFSHRHEVPRVNCVA